MRESDRLLRLRRVQHTSPETLLPWLEQKLSERPRRIALWLALLGGQELSGDLVRYDARSNCLLLVHNQEALTWVEIDRIQALSLVNGEAWLSELSDSSAGDGEPAPSRLQLRRQAEQLVARLAPAELHIPWEQLPGDERSAMHFQRFLKALGACWESIAAEALGKAALGAVRAVHIELGSSLEPVQIQDGVCKVSLTKGPDGLVSFPKDQLLKQLERQL